MKYITEGEFYFHHISGGGKGNGNDHYIVTAEREIDISNLKGVTGVRLILDDDGRKALISYLHSQVNRKAAEELGISAPTISRIRKALDMVHLGVGGDRKSHRYFKTTYDAEKERRAAERAS